MLTWMPVVLHSSTDPPEQNLFAYMNGEWEKLKEKAPLIHSDNTQQVQDVIFNCVF